MNKVTEFLPSIDLSCLGHGWILGAFQETGRSSRKMALIAFQQISEYLRRQTVSRNIILK